jgi:cation transport ATPase
VLVRNAEALEVTERIDTLVVDKTGTLTLAGPRLVRGRDRDGFAESEVLASAARSSRAASIRWRRRSSKARASGAWRSRTAATSPRTPGRGVTGMVAMARGRARNAALMEQVGVDAWSARGRADELRATGRA